MNQVHWSDLIEKQRSFIQEDEKQQKNQKDKIKRLYKDDLEKMIYENELKANNEKNQDIKRMKLLQTKEQALLKKQQMKNLELDRWRKRLSRDNYNSIEQKRQRLYESQQKQKNIYNNKYKKIQTELSEEKKSRLKHRSQEKQQISRALNEQIYSSQHKKTLEKMEDEKYSQLQAQLQLKKEQERNRFMKKLKYGYHQSHQVYKTTEQLYDSNEKKKKFFYDKLMRDEESLEQKAKEQEKGKKIGMIKEVSQFNKHYFQDRAFRQKHKSMQEVMQEHERNHMLELQIKRQKEQKLKKEEEKRMLLKEQLEKQMNEHTMMKKKAVNLSENEKKFNLSEGSYHPVLPGVSKDYSIRKQQKILENFLKH